MAPERDKQGARNEVNAPAEAPPRVEYTPRPEATPEGEVAALANVYRFLVERAEREQRAAGLEADAGGQR